MKKQFILLFVLISIINSQESNFSDSIYIGNISFFPDSCITITSQLQKKFYSQKFNKQNYRNLIDKVLAKLGKRGYYFASLQLENNKIVTENDSTFFNPEFKVRLNQKVKIDTIIYKGIENTSSDFLNKNLDKYLHEVINQSILNKIKQSIIQINFLSIGGKEEVIKTPEGDYGLLLDIKEDKMNQFSGIAGYVPPTQTKGKGYLTGKLNFSLVNPTGWGKKFDIQWSKLNQKSQQLHLSIFVPWIFKSDFSTRAVFDQIYRDTILVDRKLNFSLLESLTSTTALNFNYRFQSTLPTQYGDSIGVNSSTSHYFGVGLSKDSRDHIYNPTTGGQLNIKAFLGHSRNKNKNNIIKEFQGNISYNLPFLENIILNTSLETKLKWFDTKENRYAEYYWFGGASSMRGYPEDFFRGTKIGWSTFELRGIRGRFNRFYAFFEQGFYTGAKNKKFIFPFSYGIGVQLNTRMGLIGIDYAFDEDDTFTTAKLHLQLVTRF